MATSFILVSVLMNRVIIVEVANDWMTLVQLYSNSSDGQAGDVSTVETTKEDLIRPHFDIIPGTDKTLL